MIRSLKFGHWVALACMAALVASCGATRETSWEAQERVELDDAGKAEEQRLLAAAEEAWLQRSDEAQALAAVDAWRAATAVNPQNSDAWNALSHALYFYADCILRFDEANPDLYKNTHEEGVKAAERALVTMSSAFGDKMAAGARIEQTLDVLTVEAVPALYWRSSNLARWARLESFATLLSYKDEIRAVMQFCLDNDPEYWYQAPDRYFGAFFSVAPSFAGGDLDKSREHFEISIAAHPNYFGTRVLMAEEYTVKTGDRALYEELLNYVLDTDPASIPELVAENTCDQKKAEKDLAEIDDLF